MANKMSYIEVNDIFDELIDENRRLKQYLKVSIKFKSFVDLIFDKLKNNFDSNDLQEFQRFSKEVQQFIDKHIVKQQNEINIELKCNQMNDKNNTSCDSLISSSKLRKRNVKNCDKNSNKNKVLKINNSSKNALNNKKEINICKFIGCGKYFKTQAILKRHSLIHTNLKNLNYVCDYKGCAFKTHLPQSLNDHINKHKNIRNYKCNECDKQFVTNYNLKTHKRLIHPNNNQPVICSIDNCNKVFKNYNSLKSHQKLFHLYEKSLSCDYPKCDYKCVSNIQLKIHQIKHSEDRPFVCSFDGCSMSFKSKYALAAHSNCHNSEPKFKCLYEGCGKAFRWGSHLSKHLRIHLGLKYNCEWPGCEYGAHDKSTLKAHMIKHSDERNFVCDWPQCGKRFKTKDYLENHYRIHTNDRKYGCHWPGCQYRCVDSGNMYKHVKQVHKK